MLEAFLRPSSQAYRLSKLGRGHEEIMQQLQKQQQHHSAPATWLGIDDHDRVALTTCQHEQSWE
uniref:Uncharacterized protein n=1 Tax=Melanopsichium pennsylvanicum 4 TaxID=1398559 RepID=A0A077RD84_9BASI|nr:uncharacterized protein BN887_06211 [Melanopsichium pennsylvanicum 4]